MREVPMRYVKANQSGIVLTVVLSFLFQQPWLLAVLWVIQLAGLLTEGRFNLFVAIAKLILKGKGQETQAAELTRFNNSLAVLFLTLALISFSFSWQFAGYVFSTMLLLAASAALLGYCIGCTIYFWYKQIRAGRSFLKR
jgi:FtsH-binding integral membrane protein